MAKVFSELNVAYNTNLDANASISFVKIDDKHYLKVEGKENSPIKVGFNRICEAAANFPGSEIRIPIRGQDDLVVKFDNASGVSTVGVATATFNTSYDVGYVKGIYGPILFGTDTWNAWPTSDKNVDAYFFKGDKGRIFLRVNAKSKKPQKVLLKIKQVQTGQTLGKVRIPYTALNSVVPNTQSEANNNLFDFVYDASKNTDGDGFVRTLLFENIYYPKAGNKSGLHFASGNVYGPIEFYHVKKDKTGEVDDIRYTLLDDYNEAIKKKLGQNPTQWVIRKNGRELGVIESASERDAINSIDEDFHLRIEEVKIVGDIVDATKSKQIIWDNYVDITNDTGKLDIGDTSAYFNIINGSQELSITDGADDLSVADKDFSLVIGAIDDNLTAKLDVYHFGELEGNNNRPVVIGVHAGAWTTDQNKDEFLGSKAQFFRKRDCIFVNVEYRVSPQPPPNADGVFNGYDKNRIKFPAQIEDIASSVKWVRDNIAKYGGDPNNIILYGHGSGAHLSTLLVTNKRWLNDAGVDPAIIKGCISSSNIAWNIKNELDKYSDSLVPNTKVSIYNAFGIDPVVGGAEAKVDFELTNFAKEAYDLYSPDLHLQKELFPPILILSRGEGATLQRADDFVNKLDSVGIASTSVLHYKYPGNKTYSQTTIAGVLGITPDPPSGYALPKNVASVSQAITDFLTNKISFKFPDNAIIDYPIIDGQVYSAVSGISTVPIPASSPVVGAKSPSSDASSSSDGAKEIKPYGGGIFGAPGIDAIRIGYIDPTLGYVTGLSVCEANDYAQENRGTTFVAIDGDNSVNYLNINDVNKLTPDFSISKSKCDGLKATVKCGEPILNIYGGGGVGAKANIIIGTDGSVMGVDLVHKGYGYQYPPLVQAVDKCYFGNGATFEAFLGEISTKEESFDKESDFEDYYVCPPGTNFGTLYDTEGKEVGKWDPSLYTNPSANPIAKQVADYENLINQLKNPWWTTRMKKPSKLTGTKDKSLTVFPVSHPCQVVEVKDLLEDSPKPSSIDAKFFKKDKKIYLNVIGTGTAEIEFEMDVNDNQSIAGIAASQVVIPAEGKEIILKRTSLSKQKEKVKISGPFKAGQTYGPIKIIGADKNAGEPQVTNKKVGLLDADGKDENIKITFDIKKILGTTSKPKDTAKSESKKQDPTWSDFMNKYAISPVSPSNVPGTDFAATPFTMEWDQIFPYDGDYIFRGLCDNVGTLYLDNEKVSDLQGFNQNPNPITKNVKGGLHTIRIDLENKPDTDKPSVTPQVFDTSSYIDKADRKLWKTNPKAGKDANFIDMYGISPFDTDTKESQKKSYAGTHAIRWEKINFPVDGTYDVEVAVDDNVKIFIGNKKTGGKVEDGSGLRSVADGGDEEIFDVKGFSSPGVGKGKQVFTRDFKAGDYRIRAELEQIDVGALAKGNPMMLAINIVKKEDGTRNIISRQSWCENPLGASVTIEAPPVPVPQEPAIVFDRCPPTPLWSTRQPKSEKTWYPVKYNGYKSFIEQISKVPKKESIISEHQNVEFLVFGEGKNVNYLEFLFESIDGKESFVLKGVELEKGKKTAQYRIDKKIKKNLKYKVTAKISDKNKAGFKQVEQGLGILKGKSVDDASKTKKAGTTIFADYVGSTNDNDDIRISISKGDGEFTVGKRSAIGGRSTFELFYELESKATIGSKNTVEIKPKFIKDKTDGKIYLDMSEYPEQEYELDFKFIMSDTVKGGKGLAASKFEITGTNIQYNRYKNGKLIENDNVKKSFKIKGGKKYGPIVFSGADKGASTQIISADQIASYDAKSTDDLNGKTKKKFDKIDFNVILTNVSGVEFREPQNIEGWSKFMNRYAISPVQPLYAPGTDGGGVNYDNSWDVEFPYDGFYKFEAQADNKASVYVDGTVVLQDVVNFRETVSSNKVFIPKGKHKVKVEVENQKTEVYDTIDEKIFSTKDNVSDDNTKEVVFTVKGEANKNGSLLDDIYYTFISEDGKDSFTFKAREKDQNVSGKESNLNAIKAKFNKVGDEIFLVVTGSGSGQIKFEMDVNDNPSIAGLAASEVKIPSEGSSVSLKRSLPKTKETVKASGKFKAGQTYGPIQIIGAGSGAGKPKVTSNEIGLLDAAGSDKNIKINFDVMGSSSKLQWERDEKVTIRTNVTYKVKAHENTKKYKGVEQGLFKTKKGDSQEVGQGTGNKIFADFLGSDNDNDDIQIIVDDGEFRAFNRKKTKDGSRTTFDLEFTLKTKSASKGSGSSGKGKYSGPELDYNFTHRGWSEFMNKYSVVPASKSAEGATYNLKWSGVEFPSDGQYEYKIQADNLAVLLIDGKEVGKTTEFKGSPSTKYFDASKGKRTVEIILTNNPDAKTFDINPTGVALFISKKSPKLSSSGKSWLENPMGVSAVIIPPPCPKQVGGKGVVDKIIPTYPGTDYKSPSPISGPGAPPTVPFLMPLTGVIVKKPGINYNCSEDPIVITPSNGVVLEYKCDPFGRITEVGIPEPGQPFTEYPTIDILSETGVGVEFIPVFTPTVAPPGAPPDKIIQVTDLVGLKQTGWIDGRPYYGAVFSQDGLLYTGYYQTVGKLVRVYATLEESITGEIVTPPSAILRTGTDVTNNDPRLDIPGTPGGLVS